MRPRSSRSHSTFVPADNMTASAPHTTRSGVAPAHDRERAGRPAGVERRAVLTEAHVEHPAGAERDLGQSRPARSPGRSATPAGRRRRRRSPARRRSAVASPMMPGRVDDPRQHRRPGCAGGRAPSSSKWVPSCGEQAPHRGVRQVGDVVRALGQVPDEPRVGSAEAQVPLDGRDRPRRGCWRSWWRTGWERSGGPRRRGRGSRPRCGGPAIPGPGRPARPVARSHTMVDRPLVGDADALRPARTRSSTSRAQSSAASAYAVGVELDEARDRGVGQRLAADLDVDGGVGSDDDARTELVPTSITRMLIACPSLGASADVRLVELVGRPDAELSRASGGRTYRPASRTWPSTMARKT